MALEESHSTKEKYILLMLIKMHRLRVYSTKSNASCLNLMYHPTNHQGNHRFSIGNQVISAVRGLQDKTIVHTVGSVGIILRNPFTFVTTV